MQSKAKYFDSYYYVHGYMWSSAFHLQQWVKKVAVLKLCDILTHCTSTC